MELNISDDEVKAIRRLNARIQGRQGGINRAKRAASAKAPRRNGRIRAVKKAA
jgi:hypothetical protein